MQTPNAKTPIPRCILLALYAARMLGNFTQNPKLVAFGQQIMAAGDKLDDAQAKYAAAVKQIVLARVDVMFINHLADDGVRMAQRRAELADGKAGGAIASKLFPEGTTPIVRPFGAAQVKEMVDLGSRYQALVATWPEAPAELAIIAKLRQQYDAALTARDGAKKAARDLRIARDLIKEDFLTAYAQVAASVKAEFPRDRKMQDLFFDDIEVNDEADTAPAAEPPPPPAAP